MASKGAALDLDELGDVDGVMDLDLRGAERVAVVGRTVGIPLLTTVGEGERSHVVATERGLEDTRRVGECRGAMADSVRLDVVRVAVPAMPVVGDQDVGVLGLEELDESRRRVVDVGLPERIRIGVLVPAGHPGVAVAEPQDVGHPEDGGRALGLPPAPVDERLAKGEIVRGLAVVAVGCHDEHHPMALPRRSGHRAARQHHLIVGMSVQEHDRDGLAHRHRACHLGGRSASADPPGAVRSVAS